MSTPTPRTDAAQLDATNVSEEGGPFWAVEADFARTLETELTSALARVADLEGEISRWQKSFDGHVYVRSSKYAEQARERDSLTRQLSEAQAQLEKQRLILVANQKIMDGAGDSIRALQTQLTSAREALQTACDRMHYIAGAYMALDHGEPFAELEKAIREMGPDMDIVRRASSGHLAGRTETPPREAPVPASTWQPIETAPRDGRNLLVFDPLYFSEPVIAGFRFDLWRVANGMHIGPTHWQPLPPPPTGKEQGQ